MQCSNSRISCFFLFVIAILRIFFFLDVFINFSAEELNRGLDGNSSFFQKFRVVWKGRVVLFCFSRGKARFDRTISIVSRSMTRNETRKKRMEVKRPRGFLPKGRTSSIGEYRAEIHANNHPVQPTTGQCYSRLRQNSFCGMLFLWWQLLSLILLVVRSLCERSEIGLVMNGDVVTWLCAPLRPGQLRHLLRTRKLLTTTKWKRVDDKYLTFRIGIFGWAYARVCCRPIDQRHPPKTHAGFFISRWHWEFNNLLFNSKSSALEINGFRAVCVVYDVFWMRKRIDQKQWMKMFVFCFVESKTVWKWIGKNNDDDREREKQREKNTFVNKIVMAIQLDICGEMNKAKCLEVEAHASTLKRIHFAAIYRLIERSGGDRSYSNRLISTELLHKQSVLHHFRSDWNHWHIDTCERLTTLSDSILFILESKGETKKSANLSTRIALVHWIWHDNQCRAHRKTWPTQSQFNINRFISNSL